MKNLKRIASLVLALVMVFSLAITASAATDTKHTITITNADTDTGYEYVAYQIFEGNLVGTELQNIAWGRNIAEADEANLLAALNEIEAFKDCKNVVDVANALNGVQNNNDVAKVFADVVDDYVSGNVAGTSVYSQETGKYTIEVTGDGYYLVKNTKVPEKATDTTWTRYILEVVGDVDVNHKGSVPSVEKKVLADDADAQAKYEAVTAEIGSVKTFEFTGTLPTDINDYSTYYYVFTDTMSKGLTYAGNLTVKVNNVDVTDFFYAGTAAGDNDTTVLTVGIKDLLALEQLNPSCKEEHEHTDECTETAYSYNKLTCEGAHEHTENCYTPTEVEVGDITATTTVVVTYDAILNEDAVIGAAGNPNEVDLTYDNDPNDDGEGETIEPYPDEPSTTDPTGKTPKDNAIIYSTEIKLTKVDALTKETLTGAKFSISGTSKVIRVVNNQMFVVDEDGTYYRLKDGTYTQTVAGAIAGYKQYEGTAIDATLTYYTVDEAGVGTAYDVTGLTEVPDGVTLYTAVIYAEDAYESTSVKYTLVETLTTENVKEPFTAEGWVKEDGTLTFTGLGEGEYTITELVAPNGYNQLEDDITVTITAQVNNSDLPLATEDDLANTTTVTWTATGNPDATDGKWTVTDGAPEGEVAGIVEITVENTSGSTLPSTGGIGTTMFYIVGGILVLAAVVLLVTKKRMSVAE